jgi:hypothetical protein
VTKSGEKPWPFKRSDQHGWPAPLGGRPKDQDKKIWEAKLEVRKKRTDQEIAEAKVELEGDLALEQQYYQAVLDVAKGSIDRARAGAEAVQKAAVAIVALYTGVLGLAFSVAERPLPFRALFAAFLLGLAVVMATAFVAYLPDPREADDKRVAADQELSPADQRAARFIRWSREVALKRRKWLRASVVALGASLFFLPAPFVVIGGSEVQPAASEISWPPEPAEPANLELKKILYTAQVAEAQKEETQPIADEDKATTGFWWGAFFFALLLVLFVPQIGGGAPSSSSAGGLPEPARRSEPSS